MIVICLQKHQGVGQMLMIGWHKHQGVSKTLKNADVICEQPLIGLQSLMPNNCCTCPCACSFEASWICRFIFFGWNRARNVIIEELLAWTSQQRKWLKTGLLEAFSFLLSLFVLLGASTPDRELLGLEMRWIWYANECSQVTVLNLKLWSCCI